MYASSISNQSRQCSPRVSRVALRLVRLPCTRLDANPARHLKWALRSSKLTARIRLCRSRVGERNRRHPHAFQLSRTRSALGARLMRVRVADWTVLITLLSRPSALWSQGRYDRECKHNGHVWQQSALDNSRYLYRTPPCWSSARLQGGFIGIPDCSRTLLLRMETKPSRFHRALHTC
ncbi:hypothetical protein BD413DRAFT_512654 [Trametes elegans]|nr:hypothetical protein BD413DRAFT_512654 [Trametes elegans]